MSVCLLDKTTEVELQGAIEANGLNKEVVAGVEVDTSSVASVAIVLQAGSIETRVTVSAQAISVNTENGTTSSTVTANHQPAAATAAGTALLNQINAMVTTFRAGGTAAGALPLNFFTMPLPANFYGNAAASYDITTINGYKLFRLRQQYNTSGGDLYNSGTPRFIQFGVKFYF